MVRHTESSMHVMESLINLLSEWEIQQLVLLSFALQLFLFFTGGLRRHGTSGFLRLFIWTAYMAADFVAVYALGLLSRHEEITTEREKLRRTQPLGFYWAPFLLIHLGGQDTITAFAMEDNTLWLRHLLNLVVQVVMAIYVFLGSIGRHRVELLISGIFVFISGVIKYVERTWSMKCGSLKHLESSTGDHYKKQLPEGSNADDSASIVCDALNSMPDVHDMFSGRSLFSSDRRLIQDPNRMVKMVSIELGVMYNDLYTKALVLRTRSITILRCISHISAVVAFALYQANDKRRYRKVDIAITYTLFIGGFFLEICAMFMTMMSPWTWAWLKSRKYDKLARLSWFLFSRDIGLSKSKQRFPKSMGQYNFVSWCTGTNMQRRSTFSQRLMAVFRWLLVDLVGVEKKTIFWMSKLLDTWNEDADKMTLEYVTNEISLLRNETGPGGRPREWPNLSTLLREYLIIADIDFGNAIFKMHLRTEEHLRLYNSSPDIEENAASPDVPSGMVEVCRKLSHYMMHLLVNHPSFLPLNASAAATLEKRQEPRTSEDFISENYTRFDFGLEAQSKEVLEELIYVWTRLLIYAASKSKAEMHAAQLSSGGEIITFAWLFMAHHKMGDLQMNRIRIANADAIPSFVTERYAFYIPARRSS